MMNKLQLLHPKMSCLMKPLALCLALCSSVLFTAKADALLVIAHSESHISLNKQQIRNIFMGNGGQMGLNPVALSSANRARNLFNIKIVGLTESRIQSYWAQMRFSGRMKPPKELSDPAAVLEFVKNNKNAIAYIATDADLPEGVRVLYSVE